MDSFTMFFLIASGFTGVSLTFTNKKTRKPIKNFLAFMLIMFIVGAVISFLSR